MATVALLLLAAVAATATVVRSSGAAAAPFNKLWSLPIGGVPSGAVLSSAGNTLFFTADDGFAYAVDAFSGAPTWRTALAAPSSCAPVEVPAQGIVVAISTDSTVTAMSAATGAVVGAFNLGDSPFTGCTPVWDFNSTLIFATNRQSNSLWAINATSTSVAVGWAGNAQSGWSTPTLGGDGTVFVGAQDGYAYQYQCATGASTDFSYSGPGTNYNRPLVVRGSVLFTSPSGFIDVDYNTGNSQWQLSSATSTYSSVLASPLGDVFVFGTDDGRVVAVDPFTKTQLWATAATDAGAPIVTTPVFAGGAIVVGDAYGMIYALSPVTGSIVAASNLTHPLAKWSAPAVSTQYGAVYAAYNGSVVAFSTGNATLPPAPTPSPATSIRVNVCYSADCASACHEEVISQGACLPSSTTSSSSYTCSAAGLVRSTFDASTACSGAASATTSFAVGQCYVQPDGSFLSVLACPVA